MCEWEDGINSFTPTDSFSSIQNNEWKCPLLLLSVERVKNWVALYCQIEKFDPIFIFPHHIKIVHILILICGSIQKYSFDIPACIKRMKYANLKQEFKGELTFIQYFILQDFKTKKLNGNLDVRSYFPDIELLSLLISSWDESASSIITFKVHFQQDLITTTLQ